MHPDTASLQYDCFSHVHGISHIKIGLESALQRLGKQGFVKDETLFTLPVSTFGVDRIAIYALPDRTIAHMARQLPTGLWQSKMGDGPLLDHTLTALNGSFYGNATNTFSRNWLSHRPLYGLTLIQKVFKPFKAI